MKTQLGHLGLAISLLISSSSAFAVETVEQKPATRIDFNKMIEDNNESRQDLTKSVQAQIDNQPAPVRVIEDKRKVLDFVDVEIGLGQERPIVDRRFLQKRLGVVNPTLTLPQIS